MSKWKRVTENGYVNATFVEADINIFKLIKYKQHMPWFESTFEYSDKHKEQFDETHSVAGIRDVVTKKLYWDFDSGEISNAQKSTMKLISRLLDYGFDLDEIQIRYSGSKGFHVVIDTDTEMTPNQVEAIADKFAGDIEGYDTSLYDANQIMRIPLTKHAKTGSYCLPITYDEISSMSAEELKVLASDISGFDLEEYSKFYDTAKLKPELLIEEKIVEKTKSSDRELSFDISDVDFSNRPKGVDKARWLLMNGFFRGSETADVGERNHAFLCLASTYHNMGYDREVVLGMLNGVAELQSQRTGETIFDEWELEHNIIDQVYSPLWQGGQFSVKDKKSWLYKYAMKMEIDLSDNSDTTPSRITDMAGKFTNFVKNIDKNTILTGIKWLDTMMPIVVGSNVGLIGSSGSGKCLAKGTKVLMFNGKFKNVEDIIVGDIIMGDESTPRTILSLARGREEMFEVQPLHGDNYTVNRSHILSLYQGGKRISKGYGDIVDISVDEFLKLPKYKQRDLKTFRVGIDLPEQEVEYDPYIVGLWLGDGSKNKSDITNPEPEITQYLTERNFRVRKNVGGRCQTLIPITVRGNSNKEEKDTRLYKLAKEMSEGGVKHIPERFLINSMRNRLKLLAGIIDTDGYYANECYFEVITKDVELRDDIVYLSRSCGFPTSFSKKIGTIKETNFRGEYWRIMIRGDVHKIPTLVKRKQAKKKHFNSNISGFSLVSKGVGDYYGFEIDGNRRFIIEDFTVTHNTSIALDILSNTSKAGVTSVFISLDMNSTRMFEKILRRVTGMSKDEIYHKYQVGEGDELTAMVEQEFPNVWFYDKTATTPDDIVSYIRNVEELTGEKVKLCMIDYFERVHSDMKDDTAASKSVAAGLQDIVNETDVAMITIVQPNKYSLGGGPNSPILDYTAIKGSSFLYQAFRQIFSLWRDFYTPTTAMMDKFMSMAVIKNDLGSIGTNTFNWEGSTGTISEMSKQDRTKYEAWMAEMEEEKEETKGGNNGWT